MEQLVLVALQTASRLLQNNSNPRDRFTFSDYTATYALLDTLEIVICGFMMTRERSGASLQLPVSNASSTPLPRDRSPPRRRSTSSSRRPSLNESDKRGRPSSVDAETSRGRRGSIQGSGLGRRSFSNSNGGSSRSHEYPPDPNARPCLSGVPEEVILDDDVEPQDVGTSQIGQQHVLPLIFLACLFLIGDFARFDRATLWEKAPIHSAAALSIVFVALNEQFLLGRSATQSLWTPALLQSCASILPSPVIRSTFSDLNIFVATHIYTSLVLIALELVSLSFPALGSLVFFSITFPLYIGAFFLSSSPFSIPWSLSYLVHAKLQAGIGVATIAVIKHASAFAFCSLTLLSSALLLPVHGEILQVIPDQQAIQVFIAALGIYGAFAFWRAWASTDSPPNSPPAESESRWLPKTSAAIWGACLAILLWLGLWSAYGEDQRGEARWHIDPLGLRNAMFIPSPVNSLAPSTSSAECVRPPLPPSTQWNGTRTFHAFDDVLLVVFFSHARYDVNLDAHREAYSPYFPNILYIGPASREHEGFNHSYDVFVDSYQSDEDFPGWYKLARRMVSILLHEISVLTPASRRNPY
ncbi:hypothetical protein FRC01_008084 [Tulasnella sp. 417]|nr:hypothetical protein FRC01_008084 [Tulasnella sp. 417]